MTTVACQRQAPAGWRRRVGVAVGVLILLAANYYLRHTLEESPRRMYSFMEYFYKPQLPIIFGQLPWWRLFLPLKEVTGSWGTTTMILTYLVERVVTPAGAWELFNAVAIVTAFVASWVVFRSAVFSLTLAICVGFGTQFYHAYAVTGGIASYLLITYHMLLLTAIVQVVRRAQPEWVWQLAFALSLLLNVLAYEGWLDLLVLVWVACPFVLVILQRLERRAEASRFVRLTLLMTAVGAVYVLVKVKLGYGQVQGSESDVVFNYTSLRPIVDDVVGNVITHAYMGVSNFLPPMLVGASSFYQLGADYLIAAQHKYHEPFQYLVVMNQVFFWRYYAGIAFALVAGALCATWVRTRQSPSTWGLAIGVFLIMILVGGPTHTVIKFRPMNSEPAMTYHVTIGVLGASLVLAWLLTTAWRDMRNRRFAAAVVAAGWLMIFYGALARPPYLAHMAAQAGLGEALYPNPMKVLLAKLRVPYEAPRGAEQYRLMPYQRANDFARARTLLADLPLKAPIVDEWTVTAAHGSTTPLAGGGLEVLGDASQAGYQLLSPRIALHPATQYLLRARFEAVEGRACAGVLSGDQQRWLVPPDGTTVEYAFNSGSFDAMRIVIANCYVLDSGNPRTRIRVLGASYAVLAAQP